MTRDIYLENLLKNSLISHIEDDENHKPEYRNIPCDVCFMYENGDIYPLIVYTQPVDPKLENIESYVSSENDNGSLDYMIHAQMSEPVRPGYYVYEAVTVDYYRGDGWTTDDDATLNGGIIRPAHLSEIYLSEGFWGTLKVTWSQIKLAAYVARKNQL